MINSIRSIVRIPDLRVRILFTLGMLAVYRLGNHVPTPGVNSDRTDGVLRAEPRDLVRFRGHVFRGQPFAGDRCSR